MIRICPLELQQITMGLGVSPYYNFSGSLHLPMVASTQAGFEPFIAKHPVHHPFERPINKERRMKVRPVLSVMLLVASMATSL
jgi:hypothetical protein